MSRINLYCNKCEREMTEVNLRPVIEHAGPSRKTSVSEFETADYSFTWGKTEVKMLACDNTGCDDFSVIKLRKK